MNEQTSEARCVRCAMVVNTDKGFWEYDGDLICGFCAEEHIHPDAYLDKYPHADTYDLRDS